MNENNMMFDRQDGACAKNDLMEKFYNSSCFASQLSKRITAVNILPAGIKNAFTGFISISSIGSDGFTLADLIGLYDKCSGGISYAAPNRSIIAVTGNITPAAEKIIAKNYISGLYSLMRCTHGFAIDCGEFTPDELEHALFVICRESKTHRLAQKLCAAGLNARPVGKTAADESICIYSNGEATLLTDKGRLFADDGMGYTMNIDGSFCNLFKDVYLEASRFISVCSAGYGSHLMLPEKMTAEQLFVSLLAVFAAQKTYNAKGITIGFGDGIRSVTMPLYIPDGAFVYIYSPSCDSAGYPAVHNCMMMNSVLRDFKAMGKSFAVLPAVGSVRSTVDMQGISIMYENADDIAANNGSLLVFLNRRDTYGRFVGIVGGNR